MLRFPSAHSRMLVFALMFFLAHSGSAAETEPDPALTTYGVRNPAAPNALGVFAFLVGKWSGTAYASDAEGNVTEYQFDWIGRYVLDGMAIADEIRMPGPQGSAVQGMSLRFFDADKASWVIEYLNFNRSFLRKQVNAGTGTVKQEGTQVTIMQSGPGGTLAREMFTLVDAEHFTYRLELSQDEGQSWGESTVTMEMEREEAP